MQATAWGTSQQQVCDVIEITLDEDFVFFSWCRFEALPSHFRVYVFFIFPFAAKLQ